MNRPSPRYVTVPDDQVAAALRPDLGTGQIPRRIVNSGDAPPWSGEIAEQQTFDGNQEGLEIAIGTEAVLCTLRRLWTFVGVGVDPGSLPAGGGINTCDIRLYAIVRGLRVLILSTPIVGGPTTGFVTTAGAKCELALFVRATVVAPVDNVRGAIWGFDLSTVPPIPAP